MHYGSVAALSFGRVVSAALDPALMPAGFAGGQHGGDGRAQVIFCATHDEFSDRHPFLPQANDQDRGLGACIDLVIDVSAEGKPWRMPTRRLAS